MSANNIHWRYYLALEDDVRTLSRYVEIDKSNFSTHSVQLARILLTATSEVDVLMRQICDLRGKKAANVDEYREVLGDDASYFTYQTVNCVGFDVQVTPWKGWETGSPPIWWTSNNKVKHDRGRSFQEANLENMLNSMAGLLVANINYTLETIRLRNSHYPYEYKHAVDELRPRSSANGVRSCNQARLM